MSALAGPHGAETEGQGQGLGLGRAAQRIDHLGRALDVDAALGRRVSRSGRAAPRGCVPFGVVRPLRGWRLPRFFFAASAR